MVKENFGYLTDKEVNLIIKTSPKECFLCNNIIENYLIHTSETGYYLLISEMDNSDIEHIEQIIGRKLISKEWIEILNRVKEVNKRMEILGFNIVTRDIFIPNKKKEEER